MGSSQSEVAARGHLSLRRVQQLDSLRGFAAATVVCHHWFLAFQTDAPRWFLVPLFAGHEAVVLFFVLSGYVLSLPVWMNKQLRYPEYLLRRVSRIYLPYLAALVLAAVGCYFFFGSRIPLTPWFDRTWQTPLSVSMILQQILMDPSPVLNTAFWSLRYEMEMSFVIPFVCLLMLRGGRFSGVALVVALKIVSSLLIHSRFGEGLLSQALHYSVYFVAGSALSREQKTLKKIVSHVSKPVLWLVLLVTLVLYFYNGQLAGAQGEILVLIATCSLIILVQDDRLGLGLKSRVGEYLGRISYSWYLVHGTVLFVVLNLLYGKIPLVLTAVVYGAGSLVVAHVFCLSVEEPSLRLGKHAVERLRKRQELTDLQVEKLRG
jgi:peptidoglycan/LPS O-acetylase OafA/YrhL